MSPPESDRVPVLTRIGTALERVVSARWYRWLVGALAAVLAVLLVVHAVRFVAPGALDLGPEAERALTLLTSAAVTAFVLAGLLELLAVARAVRRRRLVLASSAETVERSAEDVERAAAELEDAIEDPAVGEAPEEVESRVERAEERADEVRETVEEVRAELSPDDAEADDSDGSSR